MEDYTGPEVYPPRAWVEECKALVKHEEVWVLIAGWPWLEAWDTGTSPQQAVHFALLDVLAPEVGAAYTEEARR